MSVGKSAEVFGLSAFVWMELQGKLREGVPYLNSGRKLTDAESGIPYSGQRLQLPHALHPGAAGAR